MDIKKFVLSYYKNATADFYINRVKAPKEALALHTHDYFQIYYIHSGKLLHHLEGSVAELAPGDVFILPPNVAHYIEKLDGDVDLRSVALATSGFTGADLSNLLNEAAIMAARDDRPVLTMEDLNEALMKITAGPAKKSTVN